VFSLSRRASSSARSSWIAAMVEVRVWAIKVGF
jgi:hypothetical protein